MKTLSALVATLAVAVSGLAFAQKTEAPKAPPAAPAVAPSTNVKPSTPPAAPTAPAAAATKGELIDINSADKKALMTLKGVGDVTADKIIKGRPFGGKDDLVKKKIITDKVYADIKDAIIAKQSAPAKK
jgi:competence protein ComEA